MVDHPPAPPPVGERAVEIAILSLVAERGIGKSISPSEAAQALALDWQTKLSAVRRAAIRLAEAGMIDILRKGKRVDPSEARGVIRLALPSTKSQD
jgi:DNA-binding transcriptional ArsR family regulator